MHHLPPPRSWPHIQPPSFQRSGLRSKPLWRISRLRRQWLVLRLRPTTTTAQEHPLALLPESNAPFQHTYPLSNTNSPNVGFSSLSPPSHPPSPTNAAKKRLSFISYSDLLSSTSTSTLPFRHSLRRRRLLKHHHIRLVPVDWGLSLGVLVGDWKVRDRV